MRKALLFPILTTLLALSAGAQTNGGPDAFGYYWYNQNDPNGPTYSWIDVKNLSGAVQITGLADDNAASGMYNMGFDFHFYWTDYNKIKLGSNGWLSFENIGNIASCFPGIPTAGGAADNLVCPMMSDLNFTTAYPGSFPNPAEMWVWSNNQDTFIVSYYDVPWWRNDAGGTTPPDWAGDNDFEVIFTSTDSSMTFQYKATTPSDLQDAQTCPTDLTIGIENITGNIGLEHSQNTVPSANTAIKFHAPAVLITIEDVTPDWNANSDNQGQFYMTGSNVNMTSNIKNVGNTSLAAATQVDGELQSLSLSTVWSDQTNVPAGLAVGNDTTVTFPSPALLSTVGQYYYNVSTSNSGDINPSNNDNTVEVSALDCANDTINLTFATMNAPDGSVNWASGDEDEGVGVFHEPPFHPIDLTRIDVWVGSDGDSLTPMPAHGFAIKIYDGDVATGPQNLLQTEFRGGANAIEASWNPVTLDSIVTIATGGYFIAYFQNGDSGALGTEAFGPISKRSYEILSGAWATYRENVTTEFLIRAHADMNCSIAREKEIAGKPKLMKLFPNPATILLNVEIWREAPGDAEIAVFDAFGKTIYQRIFPVPAVGGYKFSIPAEEMNAGLYFLSVGTGDNRMTEKFIVKH